MSTPAASLVGALPAGTMLNEYRVESVLGHGGFGITYLAEDTHLDKRVAIKEYLPNELAARVDGIAITVRSDEAREAFDWGRANFVKEARVLARFAHPNVIQVHRFFELNNTAYFVMEYAEGTTLSQVLKTERVIPEDRLRAILLPIVNGLDQVHRKGVLHRDIKPENIILRADGSPVLIDFGAARQSIGGATLSVIGVVTAGYAPLEQYGTSGVQGPWTDVYALGAVAYRSCTGMKPSDAVNRVSQDPVTPAVELCAGRYSAALLGAIDWALAVHAEERPQNVAEWIEAVEGSRPTRLRARPKPAAAFEPSPEAMQEAGATSIIDISGPVAKPAAPAPPPPAANKFVVPAAIGLVLAIGAAVFLLRKPESAPAPAPAPAPVAQAPQPAPAKPAEPTTAAPAPTPAPSEAAKPAVPEKKEPVPAPVEQPKPAPAPVVTEKPAPARPKRVAVSQMQPRATFQDCAACPQMTVLPAGTFLMGSAAGAAGAAGWEGPQHKVLLGRQLAMSRFEVTALEWQHCVADKACVEAKPGPVRGDAERAPVVNVNWKDAVTFASWLSRLSARAYRLPTEAEWEYAIRAGTTTARFWGDDRRGQCHQANGADISGQKLDPKLPAGAEPCDDEYAQLAPVGSFAANPFDLYDMAGNVWEWTQDCWADNYNKAPEDGSAVDTPGCSKRVIRGGSWRTKPESLRSANRGLSPADFRSEDLGFRLVAE